MTSELGRVELSLSDDPWLLRGAAGAVAHVAQRAGLDEEAQQNLIAATEQACLDTFKLLNSSHSPLQVSIENFADRVEVTLQHSGEALPSAGLETFAGFEDQAGDLSGLMLLSRVDRVLYNTEAGISRMTLVKYLPK